MPLCHWFLRRARHSSSTGARTGSALVASRPGYGWRTPNCAFLLRAYLTQTHEMLFDGHNHAFRVLQGIPERGIYDNMKTAVNKVGHGKHRVVNARFRAMVSHFLFESEFCNAAAGWEKGQVEKNVRDARHRLLPGCTGVRESR